MRCEREGWSATIRQGVVDAPVTMSPQSVVAFLALLESAVGENYAVGFGSHFSAPPARRISGVLILEFDPAGPRTDADFLSGACCWFSPNPKQLVGGGEDVCMGTSCCSERMEVVVGKKV